MNSKAIGPVISVTLLVVVSLVAVISYQTWFQSFQGQQLTSVEGEGDGVGTRVQDLIGTDLYVSSGFTEVVDVREVKVGNYSCASGTNLSPNINTLDISLCADGLQAGQSNEVAVITEKGVVSGTFFLDTVPFVCKNTSTAGFHSGNGSLSNPFGICNCAQLQAMENDVTAAYELTGAVDCSESTTWNWNGTAFNGFDPVGLSFTGVFDGNSRTISNVYIDRIQENQVGIFGRLSGANVSNVVVSNVTVRGNEFAGGLMGSAISGSYISNIVISGGRVDSNYRFIGGITGSLADSTLVSGVNSARVNGSTTSVGGISGSASSFSNISDSSNSGSIYAGSTPAGIVGQLLSSSRVVNSSNSGTIYGDTYNTGGIVGYIVSANLGDVTNTGLVNCGVNERCGGIAGFVQGSRITRATNSAFINSTLLRAVGGIVGSGSDLEVISSSNSGAITGTNWIGGITGIASDNVTITSSTNTGSITGQSNVGGISGYFRNSHIRNSSNTADVTGRAESGGIAGNSVENSSITYSFSTGMVNATGYDRVGGLVGELEEARDIINNSYATGDVYGDDEVGGLVGNSVSGIIENSYATGLVTGNTNLAGLAAEAGVTVTSSYWDNQTTMQSSSEGGGTGRTTSQMYMEATYTNWDFTNTWSITEGSSYPCLLWHSSCS